VVEDQKLKKHQQNVKNHQLEPENLKIKKSKT
jgi:hypothetical protein